MLWCSAFVSMPVLEVQISKTRVIFFHFFFFYYSKKHDTVTINNHAFYTADACF